MRKAYVILSYLLLVVFLVSTSGYTFSLHYCNASNELKINTGQQNQSEAYVKNLCRLNESNCCSNESSKEDFNIKSNVNIESTIELECCTLQDITFNLKVEQVLVQPFEILSINLFYTGISFFNDLLVERNSMHFVKLLGLLKPFGLDGVDYIVSLCTFLL